MRAQERIHNCGFVIEEKDGTQWCDGFRVGQLVKNGVLPCTKTRKSTELVIADPRLLATGKVCEGSTRRLRETKHPHPVLRNGRWRGRVGPGQGDTCAYGGGVGCY